MIRAGVAVLACRDIRCMCVDAVLYDVWGVEGNFASVLPPRGRLVRYVVGLGMYVG